MEETKKEENDNSTKEKTKKEDKFFVYLLQSTLGGTYVGATIDPFRRLRQHNKEITGGATATGIRVSRGESWKIFCYVCNFPTWQSALQFEWRWKQVSRKYNVKPAIKKRILALNELLSFSQSTTKSIPFCEWSIPPEVIYV
jgi:predicted GIY-YIG superfamily endonuclease